MSAAALYYVDYKILDAYKDDLPVASGDEIIEAESWEAGADALCNKILATNPRFPANTKFRDPKGRYWLEAFVRRVKAI